MAAVKYWTGSSDGDYSSAGNWLTTAAAPASGDDVVIPVGSPDITTGFAASGSCLDSFTVEEGAAAAIGTSDEYLIINTSDFTFHGIGVSYINLSTHLTNPTIRGTASPAFGKSGLYLKGSSIGVVNVTGGSVGLGLTQGSSAKITTVRVVGSAAVRVGSVATLNNFYQTDGDNKLESSSTDIVVWGGSLECRGDVSKTHKLITVHDGETVIESEGTIPTMTLYGGQTNMLGSGASRTVTALNIEPGAEFSYDPGVVTVTALNQTSGPVTINIERA